MKYFAASLLACALLLFSSCRPSPEKLLATANKYHQNKKYKEASILYQKVIAKDKKNAEAYYREGLNLLTEGNPVQAAPYFRRAIDLKPDNTDAEAKLAEIYLTAYLSNQARFKAILPEVQELKNKILKQDPNSFEGLRIQGMLALSEHKSDEALQNFAKANGVQPHSRELVGWYAEALASAGHSDQAEALVRDMLVHDKTWGPGYDFLFLLYRKGGDPQRAESVLRERVQNEPKNSIGITNLANYLLSTGRYGEAESVMQRVLDDRKAFPAARELMGDFYARAKKYDEAIQQYQAGAKEDPSRSLTYNQRVVAVYVITGRRDQAIQLAKSLAAKNPKDPVTNEVYASLLLDTGLRSDATKSLGELDNLVKNNPSNPALHLDLARALAATNDTNRALSEDLEALQQEGKSPTPRPGILVPGRIIAARIYESRGQHAQALEQCNQVLKFQENNPEARLIRDQALIGVNEPDQAEPDLRKLIEQYPQLNDARLTLGNLYLNARNPALATEQFQRVWSSNPPDPRGYVGMQEVKLMQGKVEEAVRGMTELAGKNTNIPDYTYQLAGFETVAGTTLMKSNPAQAKQYFEQAADTYKSVLKTKPNSADVWLRLGMLQTQLGQYEPALASLEQASHFDPRNAESFLRRGTLLDSLGRKKEAADLYNQVLGIDPNNPVALNNLAFINADSGTNLDLAMSFAQKAKQQAPKSPDISDTLGYVYYKKDLNSAALDIFRQNVQEQPQNPTFHLHLAMALLKNGDKQGAREEAEKALKMASPGQQAQIQNFVNQIG